MQGKEGEGLLSSGRRHRTAALQAAEVIALQAEQSELADLIEQEEGGYEQQNESFDPLTSQVAKGPRTIRKRNPEGHAGGKKGAIVHANAPCPFCLPTLGDLEPCRPA